MPLPPAPVDAFRSWAAGRWKDATDATIGRVQSGLWDVQATQAIDALGQQMARMREEQEQAQEQERQRQEAVRAQLEEGTRRQEEEAAQRRAALSSTAGGILGGIGERVGAGVSALGGAAQRGVGGLQTTGTDWASRAEDAIGGLGAALPGGAGWDADLARIRGEREAIEQQYPTPEPTGPAGFTLPQTGTPEGERITSQLAETAMRETPGGQTVLAATRAMAPQGPMTADTPGTNLLGIGQAAMTPWNVTQGVARGVTQAVPGGETSVFEGQPIPRWVPGVGGQRLTAETPVLGGLTTPDEALPFAVGVAGGTPREAMDALTLATRPVTALAQGVPYVYGRTGDVVRQVGGRVGGAARAELGTAERVVPPSVVAGLPYDVRLPTDPADLRVLTQSNGIRLTPEGVEVDLERYQKPLQAGQPVSRESVFYSPAGGRGPSYRHTEPDAPEGGSQGIRGLTVFKRPLVVERSGEGYGHALPALRKLYPGSAGQRRANDVQGAIDTVVRRLGTGVFPGQRPIVRDEMAALLVKHGGFDAADAGRVADDVLAFTPPGQEGMARYPLADAIGVNRARQHGYDGILYARGGHIQEAIDVREAVYPGPRGEFATRELGPHFQAGDPSRVGGTPALAPRHLEALRALHDDAVAGEAAGQQATDDAIARLRAAKADFAARNPPDPVTGRLRPNFHVLQDAEPAVGDAQAAWQRAVADQRGAALVRSGLRRVLDNPAGADEVRQGETFLRDALAEGQARLDEAARLSDEANDAYVDILRGLPTPRQGPEPPELPQAREAMRLARNAHTEAQQRVIGLERAVAEPFGGAGGQALTDARAEHQRVAAETRAIADALNPVQDAQMAAGDAWDNGLMAFQRSNRGAGPEDFAATPGGRQLAEAFREAEARLTTAQDAWMQAERRLTAAEAALQALEQSAGGRHVTEAVTESGFHVLDLHAPLADPAQHRRLVEAVPPDARQGFLSEAQANAKHQGGLTGQGATVAIQAGLRTAGYDPTTLSVYDVLYASGVDALTTRNGAVKPLSEMTDGDRAASVVKVEAAGGAASRAPGEPPPTGSSVRSGTGTLTAQTAAPSTQSTPVGAAALLPGGEASRPGLLGIARAAVEPLGARGALTGGERAVDVAAGTAGGVAGAATAEEDATWQERAARGALGASLGGLAGANVRQLGRVGQRALGDQTLGAVSGGQLALPGVGKTPRSRDLLGDVTTVGTGLGLANPASLAANLTGGLMRTATRVARELAGETGNPLHAFEDVVGMAVEVPRALARLPRSIWEGPTPQARALVGASIGSGLENRRNVPALVGTFGTRANAATDQLIRAINEAGASRVARARGRTGIERARDVQRAGEFATYQSGKSSPLADLMSQSRSWLSDPQASAAQRLAGGVLYGFAPYVRMPERLLVESLKTITDPVTQALPLVQALRKGDKAAMREARARIAVGGAASALFYSLWRDGGLTGDAPTDPTERRRREAEGAEWNTVRIGDATIPLRYLGDLGQSASAIASTLDGAKAAMDAGRDPGQVFEAGANEALRWVLSESYLRDLARFGGDVLEGRGANTLERIAAGTVTRPAAALAPLAAADPYEREAEGFAGQAMARVPGLRQRLPERIDPLTGAPQRRAGTGASRALGQYGSDLTPEGRELARLKVNPRTFGPTEQYAGALQTPAQRRALQRAYGSESGKAVRDTLASDAYQKADDAGKKRQLEKALREAAADADVVAGGNVARGPKEQAEYEYLAVPQFEGVRGSADEVRRQNLAIRRARALRSEYRGRHPNDPDKGEGEFYREHRKAYALAQRPSIPPEELRRRRQQIEDKLGVAAP